jgi:hypothetical protein
MDPIRGKQVASSSDFTFMLRLPETKRSSKESRSFRISPRTKDANARPLENLRLPRALEDIKDNIITIEQLDKANDQ